MMEELNVVRTSALRLGLYVLVVDAVLDVKT